MTRPGLCLSLASIEKSAVQPGSVRVSSTLEGISARADIESPSEKLVSAFLGTCVVDELCTTDGDRRLKKPVFSFLRFLPDAGCQQTIFRPAPVADRQFTRCATAYFAWPPPLSLSGGRWRHPARCADNGAG